MLTQLGIGEAIVTVMNERGAPTPVAWTRLRAPESLMDPSPTARFASVMEASPLKPKYAVSVDRDSAHEILTKRLDEAARKRAADEAGARAEKDAAREARPGPSRPRPGRGPARRPTTGG